MRRPPYINPFHTIGEESAEKPMRFYGLVVETGAAAAEKAAPGKFVIVDMIGSDWFDRNGAFKLFTGEAAGTGNRRHHRC